MTTAADTRGFSFVDLLIGLTLCALVGLIGAPLIRALIERAKQSEAQTYLGLVYEKQSGFYSEFHSYGTNLKGLGFIPDKSDSVYGVGFTANIECTPDEVLPAVGSATAFKIQNRHPEYY